MTLHTHKQENPAIRNLPVSFSEQIEKFNQLYRLPVRKVPGFAGIYYSKEQLSERLTQLHKILRDEVDEVGQIIHAVENDQHPLDTLTDLADWLGDLQIYCASEMMKFGLDISTVLSIIMASNMSKLGEDGLPIMKDGKVMKGPDYWKPEPMIKMYLAEAARNASK